MVKLHFVVIIFSASLSSGASWSWFPFPLSFFLPLTFLLLRSLSAVSSSFYLSFLHSSASLSRSLAMQSPSPFRSSSPRFPLNFLGIGSLCQCFICHFSTWPAHACAPHQFLLRNFLHTNLHSHFIHFLLSALLTPTIILTMLFFDFLLFVLLVPSSLVHSCMPA